MDRLSNLKYAKGSVKKRKRVGRGEGSGHGSQSTRGMNGQRSRSGSKKRSWFEGGQMPLQRRIPKFGFTSPFKTYFQVVNLDRIQKLSDEKKLNVELLTPESMKKLGLITSAKQPVKLLANGDYKLKINFEVNAFSQKAKEKIEAAGGSIKKI
jgi:large subunit ribosomal protein L15